MAVQTTRTLHAQFVEDIGKDLATQVVAQSGVPVVSTGLAGISQQPGETAADFQARQQAAREFTTRQQSLAGIAPQVAGQDALQTAAYEPFQRLDRFGSGITSLAGGVGGPQFQAPATSSPFSTALSTALGIGGLFGKFR